ncbi:hypothetical protein BpHYR1_022478 [Brachionus plicatilis]|uniref:Uncharacterized protein n=1 Tax=Brachionus plicatilis TaxID=10195 RepID=A0A3M7PZR2_BRAPC|nr:hypothetical protein BpHYR1_022478 [Brachionus plicatilis]
MCASNTSAASSTMTMRGPMSLSILWYLDEPVVVMAMIRAFSNTDLSFCMRISCSIDELWLNSLTSFSISDCLSTRSCSNQVK